MCVFKSCLDSRVLEDARHVPSDLAVKSFLVWAPNKLTIQSASLRRKKFGYSKKIVYITLIQKMRSILPIFRNFQGISPDFPPKMDTRVAVKALTAVTSSLNEAQPRRASTRGWHTLTYKLIRLINKIRFQQWYESHLKQEQHPVAPIKAQSARAY